MDDYISRQVILKHLEKCKGQPPEMCYSFALISEIERFVKSQPAADVVEVVRCKDCAHVNVEVRDYAMYLPKQCELYCELDELPVKPDDFCSYGERKEDEPK